VTVAVMRVSDVLRSTLAWRMVRPRVLVPAVKSAPL
jgi:hypothetical protein